MDDAAYFMKFALGSYGWPLYMFMNPCSGPWNLCGGIRYHVASNWFLELLSISRLPSKILKCSVLLRQYRVMFGDQQRRI